MSYPHERFTTPVWSNPGYMPQELIQSECSQMNQHVGSYYPYQDSQLRTHGQGVYHYNNACNVSHNITNQAYVPYLPNHEQNNYSTQSVYVPPYPPPNAAPVVPGTQNLMNNIPNNNLWSNQVVDYHTHNSISWHESCHYQSNSTYSGNNLRHSSASEITFDSGNSRESISSHHRSDIKIVYNKSREFRSKDRSLPRYERDLRETELRSKTENRSGNYSSERHSSSRNRKRLRSHDGVSPSKDRKSERTHKRDRLSRCSRDRSVRSHSRHRDSSRCYSRKSSRSPTSKTHRKHSKSPETTEKKVNSSESSGKSDKELKDLCSDSCSVSSKVDIKPREKSKTYQQSAVLSVSVDSERDILLKKWR